MATAPTPGTTRPAEETKPVVFEVGFGDDDWRWAPDATTPRDAADLRRALGFGPTEIYPALRQRRVELDIAAAMIFLARRQDDPTISFDDATEGLTFTTVYRYGVAADDVDGPADDDPKA